MLQSLRIAVLSIGALFALGALAQPAPDESPGDQSDQPDPPSRVARLAYLRGAVSFVPAGENDWVEAQINRPLITGDKLWTDHDSRAELEIGSSAVRIDQETSFDFLNLDDNTAQVELTQGALNLRVRRLYDNQVYEIDTPTLAFVINRVGEYRVSVTPNGDATIVSVRQGGGDAYGEGGARFRIEEGQSVTFNDSQLRDYIADALPPPDAFDEFIGQRDSRWDRSRTREFVSEDVIGYEDLDDNGEWTDAPEYGHVWYPTTIAVGWTPYHYGHWGWVGAYGWTWIDDAPWGFAPFHYGRWAYIGNRWGWCPGPVAVRAYYAPALVAFIGGGVGISVGGPVGWFALGPRDVYFPGYRVSRGYFASINLSGSRFERGEIDNYYGHYHRGDVDFAAINYHNRGVAGAVIAVPAAAFVGSRAVHTQAIAVNRETFANAHVSAFAAVAPTRTSLVAASAHAGRVPPAGVLDRHIVAASKPPAPVASFATREAVLQKNPGQPLSTRELHAVPAVQAQGGIARSPVLQQNIKVVTNNGVPAHTAAPLLGKGNAINAGNGVGNSNGNAGKTGVEARRVGPVVGNGQSQTLGNGNGNGRGPVTGNGQNGQVQSSQFVRGGASSNLNGQGNGNAGGKGQNGQVQSSQFVHGGANASSGLGNAANGNGNGAGVGNKNARVLSGQGQGQGPGHSAITTQQTNGPARQVTNNALGGSNGTGNVGNGNGASGQDHKYRTGNPGGAAVTGGGNSQPQYHSAQTLSGQQSQGGGSKSYQPQQQIQQQQVQHVQQPVYQPPVQHQPQIQQQVHGGGQPQGQGNNKGSGKGKGKDDDKKNGGGG